MFEVLFLTVNNLIQETASLDVLQLKESLHGDLSAQAWTLGLICSYKPPNVAHLSLELEHGGTGQPQRGRSAWQSH